jgi:hypothetical protein
VKGPFRLPQHPVPTSRPTAAAEATDEEQRFFDRPCYEFNRKLLPAWNDRYCQHCQHYLTPRCPHIEEFLDDVEDLSPE